MRTEALLKPTIIAVAIIITAFILGAAVKNRNASQNAISVVGLGTTDFTSDEIFWSGNFSSKSQTAKEAYDLIIADREKVKAFFVAKGFKPDEFNFSGVSFGRSFRTVTTITRTETREERVFDGYTATQSVSFTSKKDSVLMKKIENVIDKTSELINSGIEFNADPVQYTYSDLPGLKHNLIEKASQDAKERAQKIVKAASGEMGNLKSASMGVFQITGKGSVEEFSYGGTNDTYSKEKTARITVRLEYQLKP
jgi:hypothetical protein